MRIGIIGAGKIGGTLAALLADAGHEVAIANSRGPDTLRSLERDGVRAATVEDAAAFGDPLVIEAIPYGRLDTLPAAALEGKVLVTAANLYPGRDGEVDLEGGTESQRTARLVPGAKVVKAFNTIYFVHLRENGDPSKADDERHAIFVAGDDAEAKALVSDLIEDLGFAAVDVGGLADTARIQPDGDLYNASLTGAQARTALQT